MAVSNGTGRGGKNFQDRELAARVRTLALEQIEKVLKGKESEFKKAVILRLAGTVLPRLNEHTGEGGKELPTPILNINNVIPTNNSDKQDSETPKED